MAPMPVRLFNELFCRCDRPRQQRNRSPVGIPDEVVTLGGLSDHNNDKDCIQRHIYYNHAIFPQNRGPLESPGRVITPVNKHRTDTFAHLLSTFVIAHGHSLQSNKSLGLYFLRNE